MSTSRSTSDMFLIAFGLLQADKSRAGARGVCGMAIPSAKNGLDRANRCFLFFKAKGQTSENKATKSDEGLLLKVLLLLNLTDS